MTDTLQKQQEIRMQAGGNAKTIAIAGGLVLVFIVCLIFLEIAPTTAVLGFPEFVLFFVKRFCPPIFNNFMNFMPAMLGTVLFAVVGTYISTFFSFVFGILMCEKTNPVKPLRLVVRMFISFLRNIPVLVWASILVYIFGIGEIVGLFALILATIGFLSRSYADSIEEVTGSRLEALKACGASWGQILWHGIIPAFVPAWVRWTLFTFEINIRASAILGMVGAGGIGVLIQTNIKLFAYQEACAIIILVVLIVLVTELITNKLCEVIR